ncbi:hypothetical protein ACHAXS_000425 [Conticribra weissflogii]
MCIGSSSEPLEFFVRREPSRAGVTSSTVGMDIHQSRRFNNNKKTYLRKYISTENQDEINRELSTFSFVASSHYGNDKNEAKNNILRNMQQEIDNGGNVGNNSECVKERNYVSSLVKEMMDTSPEDWTMNEIILFACLIAIGGAFLLLCFCIISASCCVGNGGRLKDNSNHFEESLFRRGGRKSSNDESYGMTVLSEGTVATDYDYALSEDDNNRV